MTIIAFSLPKVPHRQPSIAHCYSNVNSVTNASQAASALMS